MHTASFVSPLIASLSGLAGVGIGSWLTHHWSARRELANERRKLRLSWIDNMRERIPEVIEIAGWFYLSAMNDATSVKSDNHVWSAEKTGQTLKLAHKIIQVELMLDLEDKTHVAIKHGMNEVRTCAFSRGDRLIQFENAVESLKQSCLIVLRQESARVNEKA